MQHFLKDLTIMLSGMAFHAVDTHRGTSEGPARLIFPVSVNSRAGSAIQVRYCCLSLSLKGVSRITVKALVTSNIIQSVCLVGKGRLKERCVLEPRTDFFFV